MLEIFWLVVGAFISWNLPEAIFWLVVGAFIGWNLPQPQWAKDVTAKVKSLF